MEKCDIAILSNDSSLVKKISSLYPHNTVKSLAVNTLEQSTVTVGLLIIDGMTVESAFSLANYGDEVLVIAAQLPSDMSEIPDNVEFIFAPYSESELAFRLMRIFEKVSLKKAYHLEKKVLARLEEAGKMGYFIANFADGSKNKMSDAGYTMLGCEPQDHIPSGESFETFIHPDDLPKLLECREDMQRQGFADKEFRVKRRDTGEYFWMLARTTFFEFDDAGNPTHTIGIHQDITRLKEQELQIQQMLKDDLSFAQKKLGMASLHNINKNDLLAEIKKRLEALSTLPGHEISIKNVLRFIDKSIKIDDQWELFKQHFDHVHNGFFERLSTKIPTLTLNEKKLCAYYRANLSTKDIANLLNIEVSSAKRGRNRLRKKLQLAEEDNLINWLEAV